MESTWNMFHHINHILTDMESMWNGPNISTYSQVRFNNLISNKTFDQLIT